MSRFATIALRPTAKRQRSNAGLIRSATAAAWLCGLALGAGCKRDARLVEHNLRNVSVQATTLYGIDLDEKATPKQVAYVLLRAIREDFEAKTPADREAALDKQFQICAADTIQGKNPGGETREEFIYKVVSLWTPTVSHYVGDFETEWPTARSRFRVTEPRDVKDAEPPTQECEVLLQVHDPKGDPNADVIIVIWLAQDRGFWRVVHLGFAPSTRSLAVRQGAKSRQ